MGARRNDITGAERAQIAIEAMPRHRPYGTITRLATNHRVSRQTIYNIADVGEQVLRKEMEPGQHGPQPKEKAVQVDRNRLERSTVVLTEAGVSQRDVTLCLEEMLDTKLSSSWVNAQLAKREEIAEEINQRMQPKARETLSGDEIYSNGSPNMLVVGNDTLYIYELTRQTSCDGESWGCVLLDVGDTPQFASDAGTGLASGVREAGVAVHQLDWDHLLRPMWGQSTRLEKQAYAVLEKVEERANKFDQARTEKRLEQHLKAWEKLQFEADQKLERCDAFQKIARQVDTQFGMIDLETGELRNPDTGVALLHKMGEQLQSWEGRIYQKLSTNLINWAEGLFSYQTVLSQELAPLIEQWGAPAIQALCCIWQIEADEKRHPLPLLVQENHQNLWCSSFDQAVDLLGLDQLMDAWHALTTILNRSWRGSMLAECVNSLLRPVLDKRKHSDQGCLELFRLLHNVRPFSRGKRANHSPADLAGLCIPDDPLVLLGFDPKVSI